jgi:hypothetical protein
MNSEKNYCTMGNLIEVKTTSGSILVQSFYEKGGLAVTQRVGAWGLSITLTLEGRCFDASFSTLGKATQAVDELCEVGDWTDCVICF